MQPRGESLGGLVQETVDGLGQLMAEHARILKLELLGSVATTLRQAAGLALGLGVVMIGYAFVWAGIVALVAPGVRGVANAAILVGTLHLLGGAIALEGLRRRSRRLRPDSETAFEVQKTVTALVGASPPGSGVAS